VPASRKGGFFSEGFAAVAVAEAVGVAVAVGAVPASVAVAEVVGAAVALVVAEAVGGGGGGALSAGFLSLTMTQPPRTIRAMAAGKRSNARFIEAPRVSGETQASLALFNPHLATNCLRNPGLKTVIQQSR